MAKRRNKNKAKRELTGICKKNADKSGKLVKKHELEAVNLDITDLDESTEICDLKMQVTETAKLECAATEKFSGGVKVMKGKRKKKFKAKHLKFSAIKNSKARKVVEEIKTSEETFLSPREVDGETCLDVDCGDNRAVMFLSKLCVGSKGACIKYRDGWLTPNEFQLVSGRESAKDWKRSIRHNGRSLKILLTKGLVSPHEPSAYRSPEKNLKKATIELEVTEEAKEVPATDENAINSLPVKTIEEVTVSAVTITDVTDSAHTEMLPEKYTDTTTTEHTELLPETPVTQTKSLPEMSPETVMEQNPKMPVTGVEETKTTPVTGVKETKTIPVTGVIETKTMPVTGVTENKTMPATTIPDIIRNPLPGKKRGRKPKKKRPGRKPFPKVELPIVSDVPESKPETPDTVVPVVVDKETIEVAIEPSEEPSKLTKSDETDSPVEVPAVADPRTDEERRLDEFVKSLSLTKAPVPAAVKVAPELPAIDFEQTKDVRTDGDIELEMPILQKESTLHADDRAGVEPVQQIIHGAVDTFHATVTPPPTPPSEHSIHEHKMPVDEKPDIVEMYRSRLLSPSEGLKLTINRKKVNINPGNDSTPDVNDIKPDINDVNVIKPEVNDPKPDAKQQNMQTFLLHDALSSAKRYKEQLQQSKKLGGNKSVLQVPKIKPDLSKCVKDEKPPFKDNAVLLHEKSGLAKAEQDAIKKQQLKQMRFENRKTSANKQPSHTSGQLFGGADGNAHLQNMMSRLGGVPFNELMSIMPSIYGALPFPVGNNDTVMSVLQELQRKSDMFRLMAPNGGGGVCGSPLLYPMITQQILLAMTHHMYNMYNVPQKSPQQLDKQIQPKSTEIHSGKSHGKPRLNVPYHNLHGKVQHQTPNFVHKQLHGNLIPKQQHAAVPHNKRQNVPKDIAPLSTIKSKPYDLSNKKRKHSELETDCVLDLSMKKTKIPSETDTRKSVPNGDSPLDFSVRRGSDPMKQPTQNKMHSAVSSTRIPMEIQRSAYYEALSRNAANQRKGSHSDCKCGMRRDTEDINRWSVERVCSFLVTLDGCGSYAKTFYDQGISGRLLPYLTTQHLTRTLGMKVGPALTLMNAVEQKFREKTIPQSCTACKAQPATTVLM